MVISLKCDSVRSPVNESHGPRRRDCVESATSSPTRRQSRRKKHARVNCHACSRHLALNRSIKCTTVLRTLQSISYSESALIAAPCSDRSGSPSLESSGSELSPFLPFRVLPLDLRLQLFDPAFKLTDALDEGFQVGQTRGRTCSLLRPLTSAKWWWWWWGWCPRSPCMACSFPVRNCSFLSVPLRSLLCEGFGKSILGLCGGVAHVAQVFPPVFALDQIERPLDVLLQIALGLRISPPFESTRVLVGRRLVALHIHSSAAEANLLNISLGCGEKCCGIVHQISQLVHCLSLATLDCLSQHCLILDCLGVRIPSCHG